MQIPLFLQTYTQDHKVELLTRPHRSLQIIGFLCLVWGLLIGGWGLVTLLGGAPDRGINATYFLFALGALLLGFQSILFGVRRTVDYYMSWLMITDQHIVTMTGVARVVRKLDLDISDVHGVEETLAGRVLGYGFVNATGYSGERIARVPVANPHKVLALATRSGRNLAAPADPQKRH